MRLVGQHVEIRGHVAPKVNYEVHDLVLSASAADAEIGCVLRSFVGVLLILRGYGRYVALTVCEHIEYPVCALAPVGEFADLGVVESGCGFCRCREIRYQVLPVGYGA